MTNFDPYHTWLGIPPHEQPPNYYRLLGLQVGESNDNVISDAADRQAAHLRTKQLGTNVADSQRLLNEVARARICLLDPSSRAEYDHIIAPPIASVILKPAAVSRRPKKRPQNPFIEIAKIIAGGLVGIGIAALLVRFIYARIDTLSEQKAARLVATQKTIEPQKPIVAPPSKSPVSTEKTPTGTAVSAPSVTPSASSPNTQETSLPSTQETSLPSTQGAKLLDLINANVEWKGERYDALLRTRKVSYLRIQTRDGQQFTAQIEAEGLPPLHVKGEVDEQNVTMNSQEPPPRTVSIRGEFQSQTLQLTFEGTGVRGGPIRGTFTLVPQVVSSSASVSTEPTANLPVVVPTNTSTPNIATTNTSTPNGTSEQGKDSVQSLVEPKIVESKSTPAGATPDPAVLNSPGPNKEPDKVRVRAPQLPPPIADLAVGTWEIEPINEHIRFNWAKLYVLSSQRGEVRGAIQWIGTKKERAFEIVHGQIIGERLTLHGTDQQCYFFDLALGRYRGTVAKNGKEFRNVVTVQDGRRIRDENTNERFNARWASDDVKLLPLTQAAYDAAFARRSDEDEILVHFTDYGFWTKSNSIDFLHSHRADRLVLTRLAQAKNPRVAAAALAMMQGEILRDMTNNGADISSAVKQIESSTRSFTGELMGSMIQRDAKLTEAERINDEQASRAAAEEAHRMYAENISETFNGAFNNENVKAIQLSEIQRMRLSLLGWDCALAINQQIRGLLRERPAPAAPQPKSWSHRIHDESSLIKVTLTNTGKSPLHNCVFVTEFNIDQEKAQADWNEHQQNLAAADFLLLGFAGLEGDAIDRAHVDAELRYEILSHDKGACLWLPEWKPREQVTIKLATVDGAKYGRAANLVVWTNETGLYEQKVSPSQIAAEARKVRLPRPR